MKKRILSIIALLTIIASLLYFDGGRIFEILGSHTSTAYAVGDLTVDWGVPEGNPIFVVTNFAPGDSESRIVHVDNSSSSGRPIGVRGIKTAETGGLSDVMHIVISENGTDLYGGLSPTGPKTLTAFFAESAGVNGIPLSLLGPSDSTDYEFEVTFDESADNNFQNTSVVFDLKIGISVNIPEACSEMTFAGDPIFGTQNNDHIKGTKNNDFIVLFEGDDTAEGGIGDDCIVGDSGNDKLDGGIGHDVLVGGEGNDKEEGGNGKDKLFGGAGGDTLEGGNEEDTIEGDSGNDNIRGGNGKDILGGGSGNDTIEGGNSPDMIQGNEGNDALFGGTGADDIEGGSGDDTIEAGEGPDTVHGNVGNDTIAGGTGGDSLFGDEDNDLANGGTGQDLCVAETEIQCEL